MELSNFQLIVSFIVALAVGYLTCYTIMYEDLKEKYDLLKEQAEQIEQERELPLENTTFKHYHDYHNVA